MTDLRVPMLTPVGQSCFFRALPCTFVAVTGLFAAAPRPPCFHVRAAIKVYECIKDLGFHVPARLALAILPGRHKVR